MSDDVSYAQKIIREDVVEVIVEWAGDTTIGAAIVITKNSADYGRMEYATHRPIMKIPAFAFLYLLGHAQANAY